MRSYVALVALEYFMVVFLSDSFHIHARIADFDVVEDFVVHVFGVEVSEE